MQSTSNVPRDADFDWNIFRGKYFGVKNVWTSGLSKKKMRGPSKIFLDHFFKWKKAIEKVCESVFQKDIFQKFSKGRWSSY